MGLKHARSAGGGGGVGGGARLKKNKRGVGARFIGFEARLARLKKIREVGGVQTMLT